MSFELGPSGQVHALRRETTSLPIPFKLSSFTFIMKSPRVQPQSFLLQELWTAASVGALSFYETREQVAFLRSEERY